MNRYFTEAENQAFYASRAKKSVGVMVVYRNSEGKVLIVKPNYKPGWNLVGGFVEENESPLTTALRETQEELGLTLAENRLSLLGVHYLPPAKYPEFLRIIFAADLTADEIAAIKLQTDELEEYRFVSVDDLTSFNERSTIDAARAMLTSARGLGYVEDRQLKGTTS
ncbi:MAG TPA: NUDIX hydrolase [Candidatus Saccharimonadia bacterium]